MSIFLLIYEATFPSSLPPNSTGEAPSFFFRRQGYWPFIVPMILLIYLVSPLPTSKLHPFDPSLPISPLPCTLELDAGMDGRTISNTFRHQRPHKCVVIPDRGSLHLSEPTVGEGCSEAPPRSRWCKGLRG